MELTKEEYDKACQEQVDEVCLQNSVKQFRKWCAGSGQEVTYENYKKYLAYDKGLFTERDYKLMADGFRKLEFSYNGDPPIMKWVLRSTGVVHPLDALESKEKNYVILAQCDDDSGNEVFELCEEEDLPTYEPLDAQLVGGKI